MNVYWRCARDVRVYVRVVFAVVCGRGLLCLAAPREVGLLNSTRCGSDVGTASGGVSAAA